MSNIFSSENSIFIVCSFRKFYFTQLANFFLFVRWSSVSNGWMIFSYGRHLRSVISILCALDLEISSAFANFLVDNLYFLFNLVFTFWIFIFVRAFRGRPGKHGNLIDPVSLIILHHLSTIIRDTEPLKSWNILDGPSPLWYLESTRPWSTWFFIIKN